jgi:hypothetical protein
MVTVDYILYNLPIQLYMLWIFSDIALAFARAALLVQPNNKTLAELLLL